MTNPGLPTVACRHVFAAEGQGSDFRISDRHLWTTILGQHAHQALIQAVAGASVKDVAFDLSSIFTGDQNVAAVVECLFQSFTQLFWIGQVGNPSLELLPDCTWGDLQRIRVKT